MQTNEWQWIPKQLTYNMASSLSQSLSRHGAHASYPDVEATYNALLGSAPPAPSLVFPTHLRKMWSGTEVQEWLNRQLGSSLEQTKSKDSWKRYQAWKSQQKETSVIKDKGPWRPGVTEDGHRHFVESDDFTHDVRLYLDGDFGSSEDKAAYMRGIAAALNSALLGHQPVQPILSDPS